LHVDVHAHILPRSWPELHERYGDPRWPRIEHLDACSANIMVSGDLFRHVTDQLYVVERRLEDMERTGVDHQVLSTVPVMFSYWADPARTRELARYLNEHLASVAAQHPTRFSALGTVPLNDPDLAVEELERCMLQLGMVGVEIGTNVAGVDLDDPRFRPFFERASELGALVLVHPWQVIGSRRLSKYYFLYTVAMPSETAFAVGAMIFGGVFERFPDLRVVFAHGGGSVPYIIGRMEQGWRTWEPARELLSTPPTEQIRRCYFDSLTWDRASLELLVRRVGPERVMLGSDYPFIMAEQTPGRLIDECDLSAADKALMLGGNAATLLGLSEAVA
jgi:aminocarboxymuconate-semialdehyde decarboxylase